MAKVDDIAAKFSLAGVLDEAQRPAAAIPFARFRSATSKVIRATQPIPWMKPLSALWLIPSSATA